MKTVIITGANAGIGFAAAKYLAGKPDWHVLLACRNMLKAADALRQIKEVHPSAAVDVIELDLCSLKSVRNFAKALSCRDLPPLHGLILNAGGINMKATSLEFSEDGFERTFQLNFLGHFVLAHLLLQQMQSPGRVVFVSSDLHDPAATKMGRLAPPVFGPIEEAAYGRGKFVKMNPMARYGSAKMFAMMCAREFDRKIQSNSEYEGITVNSWSPGVVPTTQAGRDMPALQKKIMMSPLFVKFMGSHLSTEEEAAQALGGLLLDPKFSSVSGRYFDGFKEIQPSLESRDVSKAKSVWEQAIRLAQLSPEEVAV